MELNLCLKSTHRGSERVQDFDLKASLNSFKSCSLKDALIDFRLKHGPNTLFQSVHYSQPDEVISVYLILLHPPFCELMADMLSLKSSGKNGPVKEDLRKACRAINSSHTT